MQMSALRKREPRKPVAIKARLKSDVGWGDTQICNVSTRGMMARHTPPPPIGSYVEVCRGPFTVVGRVRWASADRFGLQALEDIDLNELENPQRSRAAPIGDRRQRARPAIAQHPHVLDLTARLERSQRLARRMQFIVLLIAGAGMATTAMQFVEASLVRPMHLVTNTLALATR